MDTMGEITLISEAHSKDAYGIDQAELTESTVYCTVSSVTTRELLEASQMGISASLRADVYAAEYDGQKLARYDGKVYSIYRTYRSRRHQDMIELYLEERAGNAIG